MNESGIGFIGNAILSFTAGILRGLIISICVAGLIWCVYLLVQLYKMRKG